MGPGKEELTFDHEVTDGWCVIVPVGTWHNITNIGDEAVQVSTIYAPQHRAPGKVQQTKAIADADSEANQPTGLFNRTWSKTSMSDRLLPPRATR